MASQTHGGLAVAAATRRARWVWSVLAALIVGSMALAAWKAASRSVNMSAAMTPAAVDAIAPGSEVLWVLEIVAIDPIGVAQGIVLDKESETIYRRSTTKVVIHDNTQTRFVMGTSGDVRPGAVVHVTGKLRSDHAVDAEKIVILSGFVQVRNAPDTRP
jgi:hypothetical protein